MEKSKHHDRSIHPALHGKNHLLVKVQRLNGYFFATHGAVNALRESRSCIHDHGNENRHVKTLEMSAVLGFSWANDPLTAEGAQ